MFNVQPKMEYETSGTCSWDFICWFPSDDIYVDAYIGEWGKKNERAAPIQ